jgi:hypothetical protein
MGVEDEDDNEDKVGEVE